MFTVLCCLSLRPTNGLRVILNRCLKVCRSVLLWLKYYNVRFWYEIAEDNSVYTRYLGHCINKLNVLAFENEVCCEVHNPAHNVQNETESY